MSEKRLLSREQLARLRQDWRTQGRKMVLTNGVFDLLHLGHVQYLEEARRLGDVLVVGLNSDASTRRYKGPERPLVPQEERAALLLALRSVDYVTIFDEPTAGELVTTLQPDIYVKGGDYTLQGDPTNSKPLPEEPLVRAYGGAVHLIPYLPGHSTSELIAKILRVYGSNQ